MLQQGVHQLMLMVDGPVWPDSEGSCYLPEWLWIEISKITSKFLFQHRSSKNWFQENRQKTLKTVCFSPWKSVEAVEVSGRWKPVIHVWKSQGPQAIHHLSTCSPGWGSLVVSNEPFEHHPVGDHYQHQRDDVRKIKLRDCFWTCPRKPRNGKSFSVQYNRVHWCSQLPWNPKKPAFNCYPSRRNIHTLWD